MFTKNRPIIKSQLITTTVYDPFEDVKAEIGRLVHAAIINKNFREMLLSNPKRSIETGYCGENFHFPAEVLDNIQNIRAKNLEDFSCQVLQAVQPTCIHEMTVIQCHS